MTVIPHVIWVHLQEYETRIESLQRQVDLAQSMISSTCSNFTWDSERVIGEAPSGRDSSVSIYRLITVVISDFRMQLV